MDAQTHQLRPPLSRRLPPAVRTALAWCGAVAFPFVQYVTVLNCSRPGASPLRYVLPVLVLGLPVALLRRRPLPALALALVGAFAMVTIHSWYGGYTNDMRALHLVAVDAAVGYIAARWPRRVSVAAALLALLVQLAAVPFVSRGGSGAFLDVTIVVTLALATAWLVGNSIRSRREYAGALSERAAAQAVIAERLRIAREVHDMVAHSIGIIAIQAGVGSRVIDTQPAEARNALRAIEVTSRETLAGLRRTLGALRRNGSGGPDPASADPARSGSGSLDPGSLDPAPLEPTPGLADLDRLVAATTGTGVRVEVRWLGARRPYPADVELCAYRVIQESVTNVVRHAGVSECRVTVDQRDTELLVEVDDDGRGCAEPGTGYGIVGMRERVGLLGGELSAGPGPGGGFRVSARLPVPALVP